MKKIIGLGAVTGVVVFVFLRSFGRKLDRRMLAHKQADAQLV